MSQIPCECGKNPATIHVTEIVDGEKKEIHLCEDCAKKKKIYFPATNMLNLGDMLSGLIEAAGHRSTEELDKTRCPECGMTFADFRESGRLGCPNDYEVFRDGLDPLLERMHGTTKHKGRKKRARRATSRAQRLRQLRAELNEAVENEAYERAAEIRDQIYALKKELGDAAE